MRKVILFILLGCLLISMAGCGGCGDYVDDEVENVSVSLGRTGKTDSRGRVEHVLTIRNNSEKTLKSGSILVYSEDVSGRLLNSDAAYPKNVRPGSTRTASIWLEVPATASVYAKWQSARFE